MAAPEQPTPTNAGLPEAISGRAGRGARLALSVALAAAVVLFVYRGPLKALTHSDDLAVYYTATRVWLHGQNPYGLAQLRAEALRAGGVPSDLLGNSLAPPCTFVLLAPLGLLDWSTAKAAWAGVNVLSLALALWAFMRLAGPELARPRWLALGAMALAMAPVQTAVALGQVTLPAVACIALGIVAQRGRRDCMAGALLALAAALKPQMAVVFIGYALLKGRWRTVAAAAVVGAALLAMGIVPLQRAGIDWLAAMRANYAAFFHGGDGDLAGPTNFNLLQLQHPIMALGLGRTGATVVAWAATVLLGLPLLWLARRVRPEQGMLDYALVAALSLLPVYHRSYDIAILLLALTWALCQQPATLRPYARWCVVLMLPFLLPGPAGLYALGESGRVPAWVVQSWWWQGFVQPHQVWLCLAIAVVLSAALLRSAKLADDQDALKVQE